MEEIFEKIHVIEKQADKIIEEARLKAKEILKSPYNNLKKYQDEKEKELKEKLKKYEAEANKTLKKEIEQIKSKSKKEQKILLNLKKEAIEKYSKKIVEKFFG